MKPEDVCGSPAPVTPEYSDAKILRMWRQAAAELRSFARHLARTDAGLTASQVRMAVQMADELYTLKTVGKTPCVACRGVGGVQNPEYKRHVLHPEEFTERPPPYMDCPVCSGTAWINQEQSDAATSE